MPQTRIDRELLEAALVGLQLKRTEVQNKIDELARRIGKRPPASGQSIEETASAPQKRVLSPAARRRIAEAQQRRWAAFRKAKSAKKAQPRGPAAEKPARPVARKAAPRKATAKPVAAPPAAPAAPITDAASAS